MTCRRLRAGSLIWVQIWASDWPTQPISRGARCQIGLPGTRPGIEVAVLGDRSDSASPQAPKPSGPRSTGG